MQNKAAAVCDKMLQLSGVSFRLVERCIKGEIIIEGSA